MSIKMPLFFWCNQLLLSVKAKTHQTPKAFVKKSTLTKVLIGWGGLFHDINLKNDDAIVIPPFSTICG